jgi:hypothetical protein
VNHRPTRGSHQEQSIAVVELRCDEASRFRKRERLRPRAGREAPVEQIEMPEIEEEHEAHAAARRIVF